MGDLTIKDIQKQVDDWVRENGGYFNPLSIMAQITEESGEIAQVIEDLYIVTQISKLEGTLARTMNNLYGDRVKKLQDPEGKIGSEISDLFFALVCLANSHNINLERAFTETIEARYQRDKDRYK